jgi:hypothetical protein
VHWTGAIAEGHVELVRAHWDLPRGLPLAWGPSARANMATVLREHRLSPTSSPLYESLGVQGTTELALAVEPGVCYSAAIISLFGSVQTLAIGAKVNARGEVNHSASDVAGTAVSFCAHGAERALLEVESRGTALGWLVAVWETGRAPIGEP